MCTPRLSESTKGESPTPLIFYHPPLILPTPTCTTETSYIKKIRPYFCVFYLMNLHKSKAPYLVEPNWQNRLAFNSRVTILISWAPP